LSDDQRIGVKNVVPLIQGIAAGFRAKRDSGRAQGNRRHRKTDDEDKQQKKPENGGGTRLDRYV
jgi:hypothetical protein